MGSSVNIMLLEDNKNRTEEIAALLGNTGKVKMESFRDLPGALEKLSLSEYDLFLLDLENRHAPGIETYRIIHSATPEIPVLVLSDRDDSPDAAQAVKEGAEDFLCFNRLNSPLLVKSIYHAIENKKRKEHTWRLLFTIEQIPTAIIMVDFLGNVDYVNARFSVLTGYKNHEICGENINLSDLAITKSELFRALASCVSERKKLDGETAVTTRTGETRWAHYSISPVRNIEDKITHYVASIEDMTELKLKDDEIRRSEEKFRALVHNINEYVYSVTFRDRKPVSRFHSPKCVEITGYAPEEFLANENLWYSMIYDADKKLVLDSMDSIMKAQVQSSIEHRIIHRNGSVRWVSNTCTSLHDSEGNMAGLYGFILDITQRKEWELQIKKLSKAVKQSPVSVIITDRDGRIEYVNPKFTALTGFSPEEAAGRTPDQLAPDEETQLAYREIYRQVFTGKDWHGELHTRKKNGEYFWEHSLVSPIRNKKKEITHIVIVNEDITERKAAEAALRASEEALRKRNEALEKDLKLAQLIQKAFLPRKIPVINGMKIDYRYIPMEKIGGDYFSIVPLDSDTLSVFIGDVSGHGVSAALFLSLVKSATDRMLGQHAREPGKYLVGLNSLLIEEMPSFFITAIYGIFMHDTRSSTTRYIFSNGGHPYPIHYDARTGDFRQLKLGGTIVGMFEEAVYDISSVDMHSGDRIFLFTDGITEIENDKKEMIGYDDGLVEIFRRSCDGNLPSALDRVIGELHGFRGNAPVNDDIVLIGIEV